ncbi:MAG TPA: hypothetical protein VEB22_12985, partial [Phycisphaerales bacterium]|nr:hypothetical protein [Phycisphaerales bacterium]
MAHPALINAQQLRERLVGASGEEFRRFMNALVGTAARLGGVPASDIHAQQIGNVSDGGVDIHIRSAAKPDI